MTKEGRSRKPIFLLGFMGAGKSTLGKALAKDLEYAFYDTDEEVERMQKSSIEKIFQQKGERRFREAEREVLSTLCMRERSVIAVGGGTPCFYNNLEVMNEAGVTVLVKASVGKLQQRLEENKEGRPLIKGLSSEELRLFIVQKLKERAAFYEKAAHIFEVDELERDEDIAEAVRRLKQQLRL